MIEDVAAGPFGFGLLSHFAAPWAGSMSTKKKRSNYNSAFAAGTVGGASDRVGVSLPIYHTPTRGRRPA